MSTTHETLSLPWPEGAVEARVCWYGSDGWSLSHAADVWVNVKRPPAPAPAGWGGPPGSHPSQYVGKVCMFRNNVRTAWVAGVLKDVADADRFPYWNETDDSTNHFCRPLTKAEAGELLETAP